MSVAIIGSSTKENEHRVPIHPTHLAQMNPDVLNELVFEKGYGEMFGYDDNYFAALTGHPCLDRKTCLSSIDKIILPKPTEEDIKQMKPNTTLWGWVHAIQQQEITQLAIERKLTYVAWENMFYKNSRSVTHIFQTNNEMAGYCGVQHALSLKGIDGYYGPQKTIKVFSFGSVSRGAINALIVHGFHDIEVYSWRPAHLIKDRIHSIQYSQIYFDEQHKLRVKKEGQPTLISQLIESDILVNGILQDPDQPVMFFNDEDTSLFHKPCLIIDISCDDKMGFPFAKPTPFEDPMFSVGPYISYYGVDHTPSLLWDSASYQISQSLMPYIYQFTFGNYGEVMEHAVDIREGRILNTKILSFQKRESAFPYNIKQDDYSK